LRRFGDGERIHAESQSGIGERELLRRIECEWRSAIARTSSTSSVPMSIALPPELRPWLPWQSCWAWIDSNALRPRSSGVMQSTREVSGERLRFTVSRGGAFASAAFTPASEPRASVEEVEVSARRWVPGREEASASATEEEFMGWSCGDT